MLRTPVMVVTVALLASGVQAAAPPRERQPEEDRNIVTVAIRDRRFTPPVVRIQKDQTVVWVNYDDVDHTIEADDGSFSSRTLKKRGTFSYTFRKPGKYLYSCRLHPREKGTVLVEQPAPGERRTFDRGAR